MANTIPSDSHSIGDSGHVTDHNNMADVLGLLAQVQAQADGVFTTTNTTAITAVSALQTAQWETTPVFVMKTSLTSRASNTTLSNDPDLTLPVQGGSAIYTIYCVIAYDGIAGVANGDLKSDISCPGGGALNYSAIRNNAAGPTFSGAFLFNESSNASSNQFVSGTTGQGAYMIITIAGIYNAQNAASAGSLHFRWSQNTSSGTATRVQPYSFMSATRVQA